MSDAAEQRRRYADRARITSVLAFLLIPIIILTIAGSGALAVRGEDYVVRSEIEGVTSGIERVTESTQEVSKNSTSNQSFQKRDVLPHSVAVLPLKNKSPDREDAYLATAIHKEILSQLARIQGLNLIARTSVLNPAYVNGSMTVPAIAADLNVASVMTGSVYFADDNVRVTMRLFNGRTGTLLWTDTYAGRLTEMSGFQAEIASQTAGASHTGFPPELRSLINKPYTRSAEAYELYLKGRALAPDGGPRVPVEYYQFLERAIAIDPDFAVAHAAMAYGLGDALTYGVPIEGFSLQAMEKIALAHIAKVMESDADIDMAYMAQAFIHWAHQRGSPAIQAFEQAMQLSPNNVEMMADFTRFLSFIGEHDAAVKMAQRAVVLAPGDPACHYLLAHTLVFAGRPAAAADSVRRSISLTSSSGKYHLLLGEIEFLLGDDDAAKSDLEISEQLSDLNSASMEDMSILIYAYSRLGLKKDSLRVFDRFNNRVSAGEFVSTSALALAYLAIGTNNVTFDLLNRSPNEGINPLQHIKSNILNDPVLETSRFQELRRRMAHLTGGVSNISTPPF